MSGPDCGWVREALPGYAAGRLDAESRESVAEHVAACDECASELELIALLRGSMPPVPAGLAARIRQSTHRQAAVVRRPWWGLTAAAVAALALGIGVSSSPDPAAESIPAYAFEVAEGDVWTSDDGLIAGAPSFDALSEEALNQLLDELAMESAGGAA